MQSVPSRSSEAKISAHADREHDAADALELFSGRGSSQRASLRGKAGVEAFGASLVAERRAGIGRQRQGGARRWRGLRNP